MIHNFGGTWLLILYIENWVFPRANVTFFAWLKVENLYKVIGNFSKAPDPILRFVSISQVQHYAVQEETHSTTMNGSYSEQVSESYFKADLQSF